MGLRMREDLDNERHRPCCHETDAGRVVVDRLHLPQKLAHNCRR